MMNMGGGELILVALIALLIVKPKNLPQMATQLGKWFAQIQRTFQEVKSSVQENLKDNPIKEIKEKLKLQAEEDKKKKEG